MPHGRRIILVFAFLGVFAALGMSWHVHTSSIIGPDAPNCPAEFYALFSFCEDSPDDDAMKSDRPTPIEIQLRIVGLATLDSRFFTYADKEAPLVRGVMTEENVFHFLEFTQGDRGTHIMQGPKLAIQSGIPFEQTWGLHRPRPDGPAFKGNAMLRKDGRIHLHLDATFRGPNGLGPAMEPDCPDVNAKGSFVLEPGQTCFLGGLKRRTNNTFSTPLPLLSEMPWIGDWFVLSRTVETDMELMFLATVRVAN